MNNSRIDTLIKAAMLVLLCALGYIIFGSMRERVIEVGDTAPDFSITTDQGQKLSPRNFGGRVLVLNFWATWCEPCVEEIPSLVQFQRSVVGSGVVVVGVSIDKNQKLYNSFLKRFQVPFQTVRDPEANISADYGTFKVPETYIIDKSGKVVQKVIGARNWNDAELISYVKSI